MPTEKQFPENEKQDTEPILRRVVNAENTDMIIDGKDDAESKLKDAQTMMLQMQINPHFLGNTLNVINWMAIEMTMCENPVSAAIGKLARLFKSYSDATDYMTDFESEIEFTNQYADILKLRYPDTFSIEWDIDERYLNARVPRIILQPLVENAIYHGIKPLDEKGSVKISSRMENNLFVITVADSGKGMTDESIDKMNSELLSENVTYDGHVGLKNVNQRLKLIYGNDYGVKVEKSIAGGLRVVIWIPYTYTTAKLNYSAKRNLAENYVTSARDTVERVLHCMISHRKRNEVEYFPFVKPTGYNPHYPSFNFEEIYPGWEEGDTGYIEADFIAPCDREMVISVTGETEIFFNGEKPECIECENIPEPFKVHGIHSYRVKFKEGVNPVIMRQCAGSDYFEFEMYVGDESGPISWPTEYNFKLRPVISFGDMKDFEGFSYSRLYKKGETLPEMSTDKIEWIGPHPPEDVKKVIFDFSKMTSYNTACAVTKASGHIRLKHKSPIRVYSSGELVYSRDCGCYEGAIPGEVLLCVEADKTDDGFGFEVAGGSFCAPGYKSKRLDLSWIWVAGVANAAENIQFTKPYTSIDGKKTFFQFLRKDTYYRPYHNANSYGQWFYAIMLSHYSLLKMAEKLNKQEYIDYFVDSINIVCEYYDYVQYDKEKFGSPTMLFSSTRLSDIITVGPIGMAVCEYIRLTDNENGKYLLEILKNAMNDLPRSEKGVIRRTKHFAVDDLFMTIPFMARLGGKYLDEALCQLKGICDMLYMKEKKLFSHIYFTESSKANQVPWCRGNGWAMLALSEFLMYMPEDHLEREYVLQIFRELSDGILNYQGKKGMWHLVLDEPETYEETSGTGMFITAMARGVKNGYLSRDIVPKLWKAWNRLSEICIDEDGNVLGICSGSGLYTERERYRKQGACKNDDHGVGIVLLAGTEMLDL